MMHQYSIQFYKAKQTQPILGYGFLFVGLLSLLIWLLSYKQAHLQFDSTQQALLDQKSAVLKNESISKKSNITEHEVQSEKLQAAIQRSLLLPWDQLFIALENSYQPEIKLLEVLPDATDGSIRITAQTQALKYAFTYIETLKKQVGLIDVNLVEHQLINVDNQAFIQFTVEAIWSKSE